MTTVIPDDWVEALTAVVTRVYRSEVPVQHVVREEDVNAEKWQWICGELIARGVEIIVDSAGELWFVGRTGSSESQESIVQRNLN